MSRLPAKRVFFAQDIHFRESWLFFANRWGPEAESILRRHAFVLVKPDGVVARVLDTLLVVLDEYGFAPIHAVPHRFDRLSMRELWRYDLNLATTQRMAAIDLLLPATDSWLIFVRDRSESTVSATERLHALKGSARPQNARDLTNRHIRARIGARTGLLNYIHTPDETADFVRETAVLLPVEARLELVEAMDGARDLDKTLLAGAYDGVPPGPPNFSESLGRIERYCDGAQDWSAVREALSTIKGGDRRPWEYVVRTLIDRDAGVSRWDLAVFASSLAETDIAGIRPFLEYSGYGVG